MARYQRKPEVIEAVRLDDSRIMTPWKVRESDGTTRYYSDSNFEALFTPLQPEEPWTTSPCSCAVCMTLRRVEVEVT